MKRLLGPVLSLALAAGTLAFAPTAAPAAPVTSAAYSSTAAAQAAQVSLKLLGNDALKIRAAAGSASTDSQAAATSRASTSTLDAALLGAAPASVVTSSQTAPVAGANPTSPSAGGVEDGVDVLGLGVRALTGTSRAAAPLSGVCPIDGVLGEAVSTTAGLTLQPAGLVQLLRTTAITTTSTTDLVARTGTLNKQLRSTAAGGTLTAGVLGNAVQIGVSGTPSLSVTANGTAAYSPGTITVNGLELAPGASTRVDVGLVGSVTVRANNVPTTVAGTSSLPVLTLEIALVRTGILPPAAEATVDLMPLSVSATAPTSGLDCAPAAPTITTPATGSTTTDSTPDLTGTGVAGSTVTLRDGSTTLATGVPVSQAGTWTYTPTTPLADGTHTVTATQSLAGVTSPAASTRFTVDATAPAPPTITAPSNGSTLNRTTFPVTGTGEVGASVVVRSGTTTSAAVTVDANGLWSTELGPLTPGSHTVTATQTDVAGNQSQASTTVSVTVDTAAPAAPVITTPATGLVTSTATQAVRVTARAGATVDLYDGGSLVATATADGAGVATFTRTFTEGTHTLTAVQAVADLGRSATSDPVVLRVDLTTPGAPVITAPENGTSTTDRTPDVSGTGEPGATVTVREGTTVLCADVVNAAGTFACTVPVRSDGPHTFVATQVDAAGNTSPASTGVTVTVDTTAPPAPVITAPATGTSSTETRPVVRGTGEPGARVTVREGATVLCADTVGAGGDWSCTVTAALMPGAHTITATQADVAGNGSTTSAAVTYTVTTPDTAAPDAPVITAPVSPTSSTDASPVVRGTGEPGARVSVREGSTQLCADTVGTSGTWSCTVAPALSPGTHTIVAVQTDAAGNVSPTSTSVAYTVTVPDTTAPAAPAITSPAAGSSTPDTTPTVSGTGEAGAVVTVRRGATTLCTDTVDADGRWSCTVAPALTPGAVTISATQVDAAGNASGSTDVGFTVTAPDVTPPPAPVVTSPVAGSSTPDTTPTVGGTSEPGALVTVRQGTTVLCTDETDAQGVWSCTVTPPLTPGPQAITATATDAAGNTSQESASVAFTVTALDTTPPSAPAITAPTDGTSSADATPTVRGTGEPGATVSVLSGSAVLCTALVDRFGTWSCTVSPLLVGPHVLTATQADEAGNVSAVSDAIDYVVDGTDVDAPSAPSIDEPAAGSTTSDQTPVFTGTGEAGATVTVREDAAVLCTARVLPDTTWSCTPTTPLAAGPHSVTATQTDPAQNESVATEPVPFDVVVDDVQAPAAPAITTPRDGDVTTDTTPTVRGTGEASALVTVTDGQGTLCTARVDALGDWTCTPTTPLAGGSHPLTATQADEAGNVSTATPVVTIRVLVPDTTAPGAPAITSPVGGSSTADTTPTFEGTGEEGAVVTVTVGTTAVCTDTVDADGRWSCTPGTALTPGSVTATATQVDDAGNSSTPSPSVAFTITAPDTVAPGAPAITSPRDGTSTEDTTPTVEGTGEADAVVTVRIGATVVCTDTVDADGRWSCTVAPALPPGSHVLTATQVDVAGNGSQTSQPVAVTVTEPDTTAPAAPSIVSPQDRGSTDDTTPPVRGRGEPGAVVTVREGGTVLCTDTVDEDGDWACSVSPALTVGDHVLTATQTDEAGNTSPASPDVRVTVTGPDTTAPAAPVVTSPVRGSTTTSSTPTVRGTGEPGAVVTVREGTTVLCTDTVDTAGNWSCTVTSPLVAGGHEITAAQTDRAGNTSPDGTPVAFTVEAAPLAPAPPEITSPADGTASATSQPTIEGTGVPGATVSVLEGTTLLCTATVGLDGTWRCTLSAPLPPGPHSLTAIQRTATGTSGASPSGMYTVSLPAEAPGIPVITDPAAGRTVFTQATSVAVTVTGSGTPGAMVTVRDSSDRVVGTATVDANGRWSLRTGKLAPRTYSYRAVQTWAGMTSTVSDSRSFRVVSLRVRIAKGIDPTRALRPKIRGKGTPGARVTVKTTKGRVLGKAKVNASGNWTMKSKALKRGTYKVRASQTYQGQKSRSTVVKFRARPRR